MTHMFLGLQESWSNSLEHISDLYDWVTIVLIGVVCMVSYLMVFIWTLKTSYNKFLDGDSLEFVWVGIPMTVVFMLSLVSLRTLYFLEEVYDPQLTVKVVGHQWYWSYECPFFLEKSYDSYLVPSAELKLMDSRLLEVDKPLVLPVGVEIRLLTLSEDVIHSWAIPSLGLKMDAIPGRLNQLGVIINRAGVLYGQCSEMCGAYHAFMPIKVECMML